MNSGLVALNTFPPLLRHSLSNGEEGFSPPNKHLRQTTERGVEIMIFFSDAQSACTAHRPRTYSSPNLESIRELLISGSSGI